MSTRKIIVSFADLIHAGHSSVKAIPLGIALIASYALNKFGDRIKVSIFKSPDYFSEYLNKTIPRITCFSNYIWNINLNYEFARQIKLRSPDSIIVLGGPNYPIEKKGQESFLLSHPDIDFYTFRYGEQPFVGLLKILLEYEFNVSRIKASKTNFPSCHYLHNGRIFQGDLLPPILKTDYIPSPYLSSLRIASLKI